MPRALLSVTDKSGIVAFAKGLVALGYELLSTGGTANALREAGIAVVDVSAVTGFPETLDGRVKTLHPLIHGGILGDVRLVSHRESMAELGIEPISIVAVNLYAFEQTVTAPHSFEEAIESIDIGGPAMVRAAAKNHANALVVVDPADYPRVLAALQAGEASTLGASLAAKAFRHTAYYDATIARYLTQVVGDAFPTETLTVGMRWDGKQLRYGENHHQPGARYLDPLTSRMALQPANAMGKEISYNNWLDADAAWGLAKELPRGACVIVKHGNPCGVAVGSDLGESYRLAKACDPVSAYGGIVAFHAPLDDSALDAMLERGNFLEVVIASDATDASYFQRFESGPAWGKNVRGLTAVLEPAEPAIAIRSVEGAYLAQMRDSDQGEGKWTVVTTIQPSDEQMGALRFAWTIARHVKSNAIVVSQSDRTLGIGAGQMNRVQSVRLALEQAGDAARGAVLASDAFFPFPDSIETAAAAGIAAIVQPGGSKKDPEVIAAANDYGIAMVFTETRHFRH